jgi:hypothetical protein
MSRAQLGLFLIYGLALLASHVGAALNARQGKGVWVFVAPPVWLFRPEWFNEKGNRFRRFGALLWIGMFLLLPALAHGADVDPIENLTIGCKRPAKAAQVFCQCRALGGPLLRALEPKRYA